MNHNFTTLSGCLGPGPLNPYTIYIQYEHSCHVCYKYAIKFAAYHTESNYKQNKLTSPPCLCHFAQSRTPSIIHIKTPKVTSINLTLTQTLTLMNKTTPLFVPISW